MSVSIACPACEETYRIDPGRLPAAHVRASCLACGEPLFLRLADGRAPVSSAAPAEAPVWQPLVPPEPAPAEAPAPRERAFSVPAPEIAPPPVTERPVPPRATEIGPPAPPAPERLEKPLAPYLRPAAEPAAASATAPALESPPAPSAPPAEAPSRAFRTETAAASPGAARARAFTFSQVGDAAARAQRLARALVSDILVYQPKKVEQGQRDGNLKEVLREEIEKSWDEYCERLGPDVARANRVQFVAALNEILAPGNPVF
jgi:hypothetical protein